MFLQKKIRKMIRACGSEVGQYVLVAALIGGVATIASLVLLQSDLRNGLAEQRLEAVEQAEAISNDVEATLEAYGVLLESFATIIANDPDLTQEDFSEIAETIGGGYPEIINIAAAPELVVQYVHPLEPNRDVIGLDYMENVVVWAAIHRAVQQRAPMYEGPSSLVQGGDGIIVRAPVFVDLAATGSTRLWGVVGIVAELEAFLAASGLTDAADAWQLAIRRVVSSDDLGEVFQGDPQMFRNGAIITPISQNGMEWELALAPVNGWMTTAPNKTLIVTLVMSLTAFLLALAMLFIRMFFDRERARTQLLVAIESIDDAFILYDEEGNLVLSNARHGNMYTDCKCDDSEHDHPAYGEFEHKLPCGTWLKISRQPTPEGGTVELSTDITELKTAQLAAEMANEAKTDFLHVVSHELRTPLTIILGYLSFLAAPDKIPANVALRKDLIERQDGSDAAVDVIDRSLANIAQIATRAEASGQHLLSLINQILDLSKIESGKVTLERKDIAVAEILHEIDEQFTGLAARKGLALEVADSDLTVHADPLRLRQMLINLVGNAVKFTKDGSIRAWADVEGGNIWFHVKDTGAGIAAAHKDTIFNRFEQLDTSSTRSEGGVGLGLAICKQLVDLHGGAIEVESELGTGTHFKFSIPLRQELKSAA